MIKRLFDIFASTIGLLILAPVIAVVAFQVRRTLGYPVFFCQVRPGKALRKDDSLSEAIG